MKNAFVYCFIFKKINSFASVLLMSYEFGLASETHASATLVTGSISSRIYSYINVLIQVTRSGPLKLMGHSQNKNGTRLYARWELLCMSVIGKRECIVIATCERLKSFRTQCAPP